MGYIKEIWGNAWGLYSNKYLLKRFLGRFLGPSKPPHVWCVWKPAGESGFSHIFPSWSFGVWYPIGGLPKGKRWLFADSNWSTSPHTTGRVPGRDPLDGHGLVLFEANKNIGKFVWLLLSFTKFTRNSLYQLILQYEECWWCTVSTV